MTLRTSETVDQPRIRWCSIWDWKALSYVFSVCFPDSRGLEISYELRTYGRYIRIARMGGEIVGFTILVPLGTGIAWLEQIGIMPEFRGRRFGKILLEDSERISADMGLGRIELAVLPDNSTAIALYESAGYARIPREGDRLTYGKNLAIRSKLGLGIDRLDLPGRGFLSRLGSKVLYRLLVSGDLGVRNRRH